MCARERRATARSALAVFLEELFEGLLVETVVDIGVPLEGRLEQSSVSPASAGRVLLVAHIVVRHPGQLATLPREVALVPTLVQAAEEEQSVGNQRELVDVSQLDGVLGLNHIGSSLNYFINY